MFRVKVGGRGEVLAVFWDLEGTSEQSGFEELVFLGVFRGV